MQYIYDMLNWRQPPEIQEEGKRLAKEIADLSLLIMPPAEASVWECCADILYEKSDDELEPYLVELLEWLYDLNWPGASTILKRLKMFSAVKLEKPLIYSFNRSVGLGDEGLRWKYSLCELLNKNTADSSMSSDEK